MKVTASPSFNQYRMIVLGLEKKEFRDLQKGKVIDVKKDLVDKNPDAYIEVKGAKDGSTKQSVQS